MSWEMMTTHFLYVFLVEVLLWMFSGLIRFCNQGIWYVAIFCGVSSFFLISSLMWLGRQVWLCWVRRFIVLYSSIFGIVGRNKQSTFLVPLLSIIGLVVGIDQWTTEDHLFQLIIFLGCGHGLKIVYHFVENALVCNIRFPTTTFILLPDLICLTNKSHTCVLLSNVNCVSFNLISYFCLIYVY